MVSEHYPLLNAEIAKFRQDIQDTAMVVHSLIKWGEALQAYAPKPNKWEDNTFTSCYHSDGTTCTGGRWYSERKPDEEATPTTVAADSDRMC